MTAHDLSQLDVQALAARLSSLAGQERNVQADFLLHLDELDRRGSFAELGYPSLWEYCLRALHLREGAAGRRIGAMRVLRRFPQLEGALRDGRLCLTTLCVLGPVLTTENVERVAGEAAFKTKAQVEAVAAGVKPRAVAGDGLRRLPTQLAVGRAGSLPLECESALSELAAASSQAAASERAAASAGSPLRAPLSFTPPPRSAPAEVCAVAAEVWSLRVTLDVEAKRNLELLTALLSHKIPNGSLAAVLKEAVACAIEMHGRRKGAVALKQARKAVARPETPVNRAGADEGLGKGLPASRATPLRAAPSRTVPASVRRAVWTRDGGCCTFAAPDGTRCGSSWKLELDHVVAHSLGGEPTVENIRLRCRTHNVLHAQVTFGRAHMDRFVAKKNELALHLPLS